jgi:hypothetical protein
MRRLIPFMILLGACRSDQNLHVDRSVPDLTLELTSPVYGQFMDDAAVEVEGLVYPPTALVWVEGEAVEVAEDGSFQAELSVDYAYLIVDAEASLDDQTERVRVPVFAGNDPVETWPDGMTGRLLPAGLEVLGAQLGATIDATGWVSQIDAALPEVDTGWGVVFTPAGITHSGTTLDFEPDYQGLDMALVFHDLTVVYEVSVPDWGYSDTMSLGYGEVAVGGLLVPAVDDEGMVTLELTESQVDFQDPDVQFGVLEGWIVEWILTGVGEYITEPLGELVLDLVLDQVGVIEVGGPFAFEFDLFGTSLAAQLSDIYADPEGLGMEIGLGIDEEAPTGGLGIPAPPDDGGEAHAALGLHEGLFQIMIGDLVIDLLAQELDLTGSFGNLIGSAMTALDGGDQAPSGDGWCLAIEPGSAYVARLQEGIEPLAVVYLPDLQVTVGIEQGGVCEDWLVSSMAVELKLAVTEGTQIGMDLEVREGVVLSYGASEYDEQAVVDGLGAWVELAIGLLGGSFELDLADLMGGLGGGGTGDLGGLLGDISLEIVDSTQLYWNTYEPAEGLFGISMKLWGESEEPEESEEETEEELDETEESSDPEETGEDSGDSEDESSDGGSEDSEDGDSEESE